VNEQLVGFIVQGGASGILSLVVFLILLGRLVPRSTLKQVHDDFDDRIKEVFKIAKTWEEAYNRSETAREREASVRKEQEKALQECLEIGRTSLAILQGVRNAAQGAQRELTEGRD
jgi:hypothetical protein